MKTGTAQTAARAPEGAPARSRVLVGLSGRRAPLGAIAAGRLLARATNLPLHGLFTWTGPLPVGQVHKLLRLTPEALEGIVLDVGQGDAARQLTEAAAAQPTEFVVVAAEARGTDPLGVGQFVYDLLVGTTNPVIVVPPDTVPTELERILAPLDGTPAIAGAIGPAGKLARDAGAMLHILIVGEAGKATPPLSSEPGAMTPPRYIDQPQHEWPAFSSEFLQRFLDGIAGVSKDVKTRLYVGAGPPAQEILRFTELLESHLLVLVWHGALGGEHGAVFRDVLRAAHCPVLVLRA